MGLVTKKRDPQSSLALSTMLECKEKFATQPRRHPSPGLDLRTSSHQNCDKYHPCCGILLQMPEGTKAGIIPANPLIQSVLLPRAYIHWKTIRSPSNSREKYPDM